MQPQKSDVISTRLPWAGMLLLGIQNLECAFKSRLNIFNFIPKTKIPLTLFVFNVDLQLEWCIFFADRIATPSEHSL